MRCASKQRAATTFYHLLRSWLVNIMNSGGAMPNEDDEVRKRKGEGNERRSISPLFASVRRPICPHRIASLQRLAKVGAPGFVNFITAVAYHFCPA